MYCGMSTGVSLAASNVVVFLVASIYYNGSSWPEARQNKQHREPTSGDRGITDHVMNHESSGLVGMVQRFKGFSLYEGPI